MLRTIHSVIDRTPKNLLREIILVNDQSDIDISANITEHLKDNDLQNLVKVVTPPERLGLIRYKSVQQILKWIRQDNTCEFISRNSQFMFKKLKYLSFIFYT